ncbi:acyl-CoA dehydrogenase family protein [Zavarzinia compransoris]|uniref:Pimeloyl-CoA dehydrogenase small subunit n=1 Tax=Zavarzinia compransoris TaxID=1264899 RepID=A0A317E927_9PROT|nr:acyl-CoA dehydrogenase family protein [Zavarzinia compransoris]PWR23627.1 pimeloyl-CoA dehydrogenase small subunit [Zavarzinia compransoris]TDP47846.1 pimeloyl-CoA dehydrogenase small subunit [Zavarzinia compransoris]
MDFNYSDEQKLLIDSVERFIQDDYGFDTRRAILKSDEGFRRDLWQKFGELGWLAVPFAEEDGGLGGTPVETMIIMESFGRGLVVEPYLSTVVLAGGLLRAGGTPAQRETVLPDLMAGGLIVAVGYAEPTSRFNLADVSTTATATGGGYVLKGRKSVVLHGPMADKVIVSARTSGGQRDEAGITLFLVDAGAAGVTRQDYPTVDGLRASELVLDGVAVGADAVVGEVGSGFLLLEKAVDEATAAICAEAVGAMEVLHKATLEYARTRVQFGQPIGRFQVIQHRLVDMYIAYEQAKSLAIMANLKLDAPREERRRAVSAAKVQIGKSARFVGQQAVQLHGGMGMTDELNVGHYFKRLTMIETLFGNTDYHLKRYAA